MTEIPVLSICSYKNKAWEELNCISQNVFCSSLDLVLQQLGDSASTSRFTLDLLVGLQLLPYSSYLYLR